MELKGKKINFLGDSLTEGYGVEDKQDIFVSILERECGLAEARNYGISGTRIAKQTVPYGEPSWEQDFQSRVATMDPDADIVVVFGGTNDYGHGDAKLGTPDDDDPYTFYGGLNRLFTGLMERYPRAVIVCVTPPHRVDENDPRGGHIRDHATAVLSGYVDIIKEVCARYSVPVLDLYAASGLQPAIKANREAYFVDDLHPNAAGHRVIADRIKGFLSAY